jgi:hypothetical protein
MAGTQLPIKMNKNDSLNTSHNKTPKPEHKSFIYKEYNMKEQCSRYTGNSKRKMHPDNVNYKGNNILNAPYLIKSDTKAQLFEVRNDYKPYITKRKIESEVQEFKKSCSLSKMKKAHKNDTSFDNPLKTIRDDQAKIISFSAKKPLYIDDTTDFINNKFSNIISHQSVSRNIKSHISHTQEISSPRKSAIIQNESKEKLVNAIKPQPDTQADKLFEHINKLEGHDLETPVNELLEKRDSKRGSN